MIYWISYLVIGGIAGWLAGQVMKEGSKGLGYNILLGVVGAYVGGVLFRLFGLTAFMGGPIGSLITATAGASLLLFLSGKFLGSGKK